MKYLVFSDVHANAEALETVLREASLTRVDSLVSLGDVVGYGADPERCVHLVEENADIKICGNHDLAAAGVTDFSGFNTIASISIEWTRHVLGEKDIRLIRDYDPIVSRGECLFTHSSPCDPLGWEYIYTMAQAERIFGQFEERFIFIGHTHIPGVISRRSGGGAKIERKTTLALDPETRYLINTGSVGQPRDGLNRASFTLIDLDSGIMEMKRVLYDVAGAQMKIRTEGLPESLAARLATAR